MKLPHALLAGLLLVVLGILAGARRQPNAVTKVPVPGFIRSLMSRRIRFVSLVSRLFSLCASSVPDE